MWAKELRYLNVCVDEAGDYWARLFQTNQDEDNRATIPQPPPYPTNDVAQLAGVFVDDARLPEDKDVTDEEIKTLREMVDSWIVKRKEEAAAVVDLDADDDGEEGMGGGDGGGGGGARGGGDGGGDGDGGGGGEGGGGGGDGNGGGGGGGGDAADGHRKRGSGTGTGGDAAAGGGTAAQPCRVQHPGGGAAGGGGGGGGEAAASGDAASGSDALSLKTGRLPSCQRHPFDRSDEEDDVVRRPRKRLWSRRRISGARGVNNSMGSDSEFAPDASRRRATRLSRMLVSCVYLVWFGLLIFSLLCFAWWWAGGGGERGAREEERTGLGAHCPGGGERGGHGGCGEGAYCPPPPPPPRRRWSIL